VGEGANLSSFLTIFISVQSEIEVLTEVGGGQDVNDRGGNTKLS